jgi:hypothetical protein
MKSAPLYVAAGGGGDVLAAAAVAQSHGELSPVIATWAWERLLVDPLPGPRGRADFRGLTAPAPDVRVISGSVTAVPPAGSLLPATADALGATLVLLDPAQGTQGLARQIDAAATWSRAAGVTVVDVGGDVLGAPGDPGLRSPLADVASMVAAAIVDSSGDLVILGPGADGELQPELVRQRLRDLGARSQDRLPLETAERLLEVLTWHPSEATAVVAAAVLGHRGLVEIRDQGYRVDLTEDLASPWTVELRGAVPPASLLGAIAKTETLGELRRAFADRFGVDEIGYEERKAGRRAGTNVARLDMDVVGLALAEGADRGSSWFTRRRLQEALYPARVDSLELAAALGERWSPPLVSTGLAAERAGGRRHQTVA